LYVPGLSEDFPFPISEEKRARLKGSLYGEKCHAVMIHEAGENQQQMLGPT
jgi:hypothetical protein